MPLVDRTDFVTFEVAIAYNEAGMNIAWNFVTTAGVMTTTAFTPTTAGLHDWLEEGTDEGMYSVEIPASTGTVNNDTEGFGWISGETGTTLPFRGPVVGFRAAAINNSLVDGTTVDVNVTAMAAGVVTAAVVADAAIDNATFAADVGSTAYATNIIALAVRKVLDEIKLDHLIAVADGDDPVNGSIMAHIASTTEDWSTFVPSTDSLQAHRDHSTTVKSTVDNIESGVGIIVQDTNEMQGKLPTNKFMGSSDGADDDGNINSILAGTVTNAQGADVATDVAAMLDVNNRVDVGSWLGTAVTLGSGAPDVNIASTDNIDLSVTQKASVNTEADNAIITARLDELLAADSDIDGAAPPVVGSVFHELLTKTSGSFTYDQTTDSLEAVRDRGDATWVTGPTAAVIADEVWNEDATGHQTGGTFGQAIGDPGATAKSLWQATVSDAAGVSVSADVIAIKAETSLIVGDTNELQADDVPGLIAALNDLAASDILTTALTETYAANGATPTLTQAIMAVHQALMDFSISGTSITVEKLDGTTAFVSTLDDGTNPTSSNRA